MFRLSKELCRYLIEILEPYLKSQQRASDLPVLLALKFYASGSYQLDIASNIFINVSQSTVSNCVTEVTEALNRRGIFNEWVVFPNNMEKLNKIRQSFYEKHGIPGVIGCIDCTHVAISPPNIEDGEYPEHLYVNRKNYHSINVQLICDADLRIINVNAKYPGSTNDSYIWNNSNVQILMRNLLMSGHTDYFLLGYSGYPLRTWLLTPFNEFVPNSPEHHYNIVHKSTRAKIERCNGVLETRFGCLLKYRTLHYQPEKCCKIINACVVLHNMCREYNISDEEEINEEIDLGVHMELLHEEVEEEELTSRRLNPELAEGRKVRNSLVRTLNRR